MSYVGPFPIEPKQGGTGDTTLTNNGVLIGKGTSPISSLVALLNGQLVIGNTGNPPSVGYITSLGGTITISFGAGTINLESGATGILNYTSVTTSPYVVLSTDDYLGVTTSAIAITINLPNAPVTGRIFVIKDSTGTAATHNITITTVGGAVNIDGATSQTISTNYQSMSIIFNGTSYEIY